jgi:uncharacterized repeat protein (TIGR03803 family)
VLHAFANGLDGGLPYGNVVGDKSGNLYGTAYEGGEGGVGLVFELSPPGSGGTSWTETGIYSFQGPPSDTELPHAGLVRTASGILYGTALSGGPNEGGAVFRLKPPSNGGTNWTETILHFFGASPNDGSQPAANLLMPADGNLYGTTSKGGGNKNAGTVFKVKP